MHVGMELNKALDVTNKTIQLPTFTNFDVECIVDSYNHGIRQIFVILQNKRMYYKIKIIDRIWLGRALLKIIAKIESRQGPLNLHEIANEADAILVDRGDLSKLESR